MKPYYLIVVAVLALAVGVLIGHLVPTMKMKPAASVSSASVIAQRDRSDGQTMTGSGMATSSVPTMATSSMSHAMDNMIAALEGKTGDEFDQAFLEQMIVHHQGAIEMAQEVLKKSNRRELIGLATDIITAQTREIDQMRQWLSMWFGGK